MLKMKDKPVFSNETINLFKKYKINENPKIADLDHTIGFRYTSIISKFNFAISFVLVMGIDENEQYYERLDPAELFFSFDNPVTSEMSELYVNNLDNNTNFDELISSFFDFINTRYGGAALST